MLRVSGVASVACVALHFHVFILSAVSLAYINNIKLNITICNTIAHTPEITKYQMLRMLRLLRDTPDKKFF